MGRLFLACLGLLALAGVARAQANVGIVVGTFTADGVLDMPRLTNAQYMIDFTAGAGSVAATCKLAAPAPFFTPVVTTMIPILGAAATTCTADCAMRPTFDCAVWRFTMSTCVGCNVVVYGYGREG
jgi:hypothetical protein